jgi:hypothetical protein
MLSSGTARSREYSAVSSITDNETAAGVVEVGKTCPLGILGSEAQPDILSLMSR